MATIRGAKGLGLALILVGSAAWATEYKEREMHVTKKSASHALEVLTAYSKTCQSGCVYRAPNVKVVERVEYERTENSWYLWTWVSHPVRDLKYFSRVTHASLADGAAMLTINLVTDTAVLDKLRKATGKQHQSDLDGSRTSIVLRPQADGTTLLTQEMMVNAGALMSVFSAQIREGMKASAAANFSNIDK